MSKYIIVWTKPNKMYFNVLNLHCCKKTGKFIAYYKEYRQCNNKKDASVRIRQNKMNYQNHKDYVINRNLNFYYKMKNDNCYIEWFFGYKYLITEYTF